MFLVRNIGEDGFVYIECNISKLLDISAKGKIWQKSKKEKRQKIS